MPDNNINNDTSSNVDDSNNTNNYSSGTEKGAYGDSFNEDVAGKIFVGGLSWETTEQR